MSDERYISLRLRSRVLALSGVVLASACTAILGVGDRQLDPELDGGPRDHGDTSVLGGRGNGDGSTPGTGSKSGSGNTDGGDGGNSGRGGTGAGGGSASGGGGGAVGGSGAGGGTSVCTLPVDADPTCHLGTCSDPVTAIAAGGTFACAVLKTNQVACWGQNDHGQLGVPVDDPSLGGCMVGGKCVPCRSSAKIVPGLTNVAAVAAGWDSACATKTDGSLWCWGNDTSGQLGRGSTPDAGDVCSGGVCYDSTPVKVGPFPNELTRGIPPDGVTHAAVGADFVCTGVSYGGGSTRSILCWGDNGQGELGHPSSLASQQPPRMPTSAIDGYTPDAVAVVSLGKANAAACQLTAFHQSSFAICWGRSYQGSLDGIAAGACADGQQNCATSGGQLKADIIAAYDDLALGDGFTCAKQADAIYCLGSNADRVLATPADANAHATGIVVSTGVTGIDSMSGRFRHLCVHTSANQLVCWGFSRYGETGTSGSEVCASTAAKECVGPTAVPLITATQVSAGAYFTVALHTDGTVLAWGINAAGQLGHSPKSDPNCVDAPCSAAPVPVVFAK